MICINGIIFLLATLVVTEVHVITVKDFKVSDPEWTGRVFPDLNNEELTPEKHEKDSNGRIPMGLRDKNCDLGVDPKGLDGDLGPQSYACFDDKSHYRPNPQVHPILKKDYIPAAFIPWHHCMNESIIYEKVIPTFGDHRPLWPKYGEYTFLPKQRWVHSLEHGSIAMLYHPCADKNEVDSLRKILKGCLYQYVITSFNELNQERPLALVAWGIKLEMSKVDNQIVLDFIRRNAYKAPEKVRGDGQYELNLIEAAPTDLQGREDNVCAHIS